ncbi:NAD(P)-dependent oxidoreductase [Psychrobacter sp. S1-30-MNA-CIBAN-0213]|uniref:NAD(P)-dependent oxidoreductase n=1 Tax=Psychrobacter sp. S1-30-MNA-CIBAN-0213 TaxID=3140456 RepID=UPI00332CBC2E
MKAVLLEEKRFAADLERPTPKKITDYVAFEETPQDNKTIIERCQDADIMINGSLRIEREVIEALPNLKLIQLLSVGSNHIDKQACEDNDVKVLNAPDFASATVAEHTMMLLLSAMRASIHYHNKVKSGEWKEKGRADIIDAEAIDLEGLTIGMIGIGDIGKRITKLAKAYDMNVLWAERQGRKPRNDDYTDFETVLSKSDVITIHCPLTEETKHLINQDTLSKMSKKPLLVNVARGKIVDSEALASAVKQEQILGYATDVFEQEPAGENDPIVQLANEGHPRIILTPHMGAGSRASQVKLWKIITRQINDFIENS